MRSSAGQRTHSTAVEWIPVLVLPLVALGIARTLEPWVFMWSLAFSIYAGLKWLTWRKVRAPLRHSTWRSIAYLLAWPGMDAESFLDIKRRVPAPAPRIWIRAVLETGIGAVMFWGLARSLPPHHLMLRGWIGMIGLVLLLHFGTFQIAALFWQNLGIDAEPIMAAPLRSQSLSELWGRRWNLGFRQLGHDLVFSPLRRIVGIKGAGFLVFLVSGLIHDLVISVPAGGGYGRPTVYFVLQGLGVIVERSTLGRNTGLGSGLCGWLFTLIVSLGPIVLLFHPPFVQNVIIPFMKATHAI